jgi:predicted aspartyl protease
MRSMVRSLGLLLLLASVVPGAQGQVARADEASDRLAVHLRTGQYDDARQLIDALLAVEPRDDLRNMRALFGTAPNMRVRPGASSFACTVTDTGVRLPVIVNDRRVDWLVDTGANVSIISDAEARRLGFEVRESAGRAGDSAGGSIDVRLAIASQVLIGSTRFEDVAFLVTSSDRMPWLELPAGRQGILGLPLLIALDRLRWTGAGLCHTGSAAGSKPQVTGGPNLRYNRLHVIGTVELEGRTTEFVLDTGNQAGTQLWERFARDFESMVKDRGRKDTARVTQMGGTSVHEVVTIPKVQLKIGDKMTTLEKANVFSRPVGDQRFHGLLGMDVLSQSDDVTIDFRAMTLILR